ncbi:CrcB family protein [Corynebacterium aquatimens]|uniref:fluoride efflux transporter FluC n=1 Tax=Corynebacterium TaxID=1716 RepID=UPI001F4489DB|nr:MULTISPECIES: CrcB family protein [Corynebacterium]QYH19287.1 CrcB family protein [Corynebacterium aquatimens]UIZ91817.1 CrcB family protein [Corynebacterium sp. CNCTC7651]
MLNVQVLLVGVAAVFAGGFAGGVLRWWLTRLIPNPRAATFAANVAAAGVLGFVAMGPAMWQIAVGAGFAGSLSTFSTLAREVGELIKKKDYAEATKYVLATAAIGVASAGFGMMWAPR